MAQRKTLTERQIAVLRWIQDDCPDGVMTDETYRISAGALRNRGLVKTSGRGATWTAGITDEGRRYLEKVDSADPPIPRQDGGGVAAQFVADVVAAGGSLRVPRHVYWRKGSVDYRRRAELAERHGKVPRGKRLEVKSVSPDELQIDLVDGPPGSDRDVMPVPVLDHVSRYHPVVARFRELTDRHEVSRAQLPRVSRLLHALVVEAERRGHGVDVPADKRPARSREARWSGPQDGHLVITVDGVSTSVRVSEEGLQSRAYWARDDSEYAFGPGSRNRRRRDVAEYEGGSTGRLRLSIVPAYGSGSRQVNWADRTRWSVEHKLPELLREIEVRAAEERHARHLRELEAERRERARQQAIDRALRDYVDHLRAEALNNQVADWLHVRDIRAYCDAAEATCADEPAAREWIMWCRAHADAIDPLRVPPRPPALPEKIRGDQLRPFLHGFEPDYLVTYEPPTGPTPSRDFSAAQQSGG